jgi:hypothetical protein
MLDAQSLKLYRVVMPMRSHQRKSPATACNSHEALQKKVQLQYSTWIVREITATISIGLLVSIMLWSSILGMSGNMGPGKDVVVGPVAEVDHDGR